MRGAGSSQGPCAGTPQRAAKRPSRAPRAGTAPPPRPPPPRRMRGAGSSPGPCAGTPQRAAKRPSCAPGKSPCLTAPWDPCGRPRLQPTTGRPGQQVPRNPKALHIQNTVAEHVDDLRIAPVWDPLLVRAVKVDVPVQPQRRPVAVDQAQEGLETDVGPVLPVPAAEGRRAGDKNPRRSPP